MKKNWALTVLKYIQDPISFILLILLIKIAAFQIIIFDNKSFFHIFLVEFPFWAFTLTFVMLLFRKRTWLSLLVWNLCLSVLFIIIIYYTRYFSTIPSYYDVKQIYQSNSVGGTVALLGKPSDYLFFLDLILLVPFYKYLSKKYSFSIVKLKQLSLTFACLILIMTVVAFRHPLVDVSYFAKQHGYIQSQIVQAYERGLGKAFASNPTLSDQELEALKGNEFVPFIEHSTFGLAKDRHLFIIQVESLQEFVINRTVGGEEITPNLNKLLADSAYFDNVYQQIGAGNTSDAEWLMHTSLYPEGMDPIVNMINDNELPSLVRTLKKNGYGTATYHADDIKYWNRDLLYPALGFDYIFTSEEIPKEKEIGFGPADEVLFQFVQSQLPVQVRKHSLMYSNIVTLTSHTPFVMPLEYELLNLPTEFEGTYVGNYLQSIRYTDEQIGQFVRQLKRLGIYNKSLILTFGDHSGLHGAPVTETDRTLLEKLLGHEYNLNDRFKIPVLFIAPGLLKGEVYSHLGGQVDLMPTLLNLLGMEHDRQMMGHNLFQYKSNLLGMRYYLPGGSFISNGLFYTAPSAKLPAVLYNRKTMERENNINRIEEKIDNTLSILQYSDFKRRELTNK